jgi:preprotein translocase subunit SecG
MFTFLLVVQAIVAASLVGVILMQRSEGGGLGMGGSPSGLMSARGAADFLTRATTILASMFILLSIALATIASINHRSSEIDTSLARQPVAQQEQAPVDDPLAAAAEQATNGSAPANVAVPPADAPVPPAE